jgi:hypothetical protein
MEGSILSPLLLVWYINDLVKLLRQEKLGCFVGGDNCGCLLYAVLYIVLYCIGSKPTGVLVDERLCLLVGLVASCLNSKISLFKNVASIMLFRHCFYRFCDTCNMLCI